MAELFRYTSFNAKHLSVAKVRGKVLAALNKESKYIESLYAQTIATWNDPPDVDSTFQFKGGDVVLFVGLQGTDKEILKWVLLDQGFHRHVRVSEDWRSKTYPNTLKSYSGQGSVIGREQNAVGYVEPRRWTSIIRKRTRGRLTDAVKQAIREGLS